MRITRLRLNGFKSFVDPTDLVIAEGLTGVVGPNGCGKSNLLEALRWVMGENRPTAMRGDGMEDVIFAGSSSRPARAFAEVVLQIDNSERLAPAGFNDSDRLDVARRITRDAGSAYRLNGREVRARDVQILFADASTGAHSPALVRQGQIAELINARPRARRRILEEAAGISGLYQRRHEAELRLRATEANLLRVDDTVENLAGQLASLARQARHAARYREIAAALRRAEAVLLWRRWRDAEDARAAAAAALAEAARAAGRAEAGARAAVQSRETADAALPPLREEEAIAGAVLQRLLVERDGIAEDERRARAEIAALEARIAQLDRDSAREAALDRDAAETVARLDREAAELVEATEGHGERLTEAAEAARAAAAALTGLEERLAELTEDAARLAARHQSAQRMLADARTLNTRHRAEADRAAQARDAAEAAGRAAADEVATAQQALEEATAMAASVETTLADTDEARAEAQSREAAARAALAEADGEAGALRAERQALARLVDREAAAGTQLLDRLEVAPGYEAALGAALADDLRASEVEGSAPSGWATLPDWDLPQPLPAGCTPLAAHVTAPPVLRRRLGQIGLVGSAAQGFAIQPALGPGQQLVSRAGDLWRWDGYRAAAEDAPSAAALRLRQLNRLVELRLDLEDAEARAEGARRAHVVLAARLVELSEADRRAREARRGADRLQAEAARTLSRAEAGRDMAASRAESARLALARHREEAAAAAARMAEAEAALAALDDPEAARRAMERMRAEVDGARQRMLAARSTHDALHRAGEARAQRAAQVEREQAAWRSRQNSAGARLQELAARRAAAASELAEARDGPEVLARRRVELSDAIEVAEARNTAAAEAREAAEGAQRRAAEAERLTERAASEAREARARSEARAEAAAAGLAEAEARIAEVTGAPPETLRETLADEDAGEALPDAAEAEAEVARLRRARDALGPVNLRAEEDARELRTEHDTLLHEKADLEAAVAKLRAGISALNREGRERLLTAFEQVNANFATLFSHLFGGGEARLVLVESDDPLEAGLEIMCQPPGKKLSTLSLLSGGEQTLTALALIFGVFLTNPAPICVLDEVDAPLDDANVARFCDLLDEMTRRTETRFLIITHNAITMARMDRLFGVTMAEAGVSQLVSVDLRRAEALVA